MSNNFYSAENLITPQISPNGLYVLKDKRYLQGETPKEMFLRVADTLIKAEKGDKSTMSLRNRFYNVMASLDFLPNSPTLLNAGRPLGQLAACFVVPVGDSMEEIFDAIKNMAMIQKTGGGTGFNFSNLRPKNDSVSSTEGEASGPLSFIHAFNACTEQIKQGGARRGANMGILRVDHPDIMEFIKAKEHEGELSNFNLSVGITDEFMDALMSDDVFALRFNGKVYKTMPAKEIWNALIYYAWLTGDPGIVFLDTIEEDNPTPQIGVLNKTNPCGEQPLLDWEACDLGSINIFHMLVDEIDYTKPPIVNINIDKLTECVWLATRMLDDVVDVNKYPLPQIEKMCLGNRKIGIGQMGWGDVFFKLRIPYDSPEAITLIQQVSKIIQEESHKASSELAVLKGVFPNWEGSIWAKNGIKMRNAATTTIAPTGTISVIAGVSSSTEPKFGLAVTKHLADSDKTLKMVDEQVVQYITQNYAENEAKILLSYVIEHGSFAGTDMVDEKTKEIFKTAHEITPLDHVRMQTAVQEFVDNAVSKTINFNEDVTPDDIGKVLISAYTWGCKGVTVYRNNCRKNQPLTTGTNDSAKVATVAEKKPVMRRPDVLQGITKKVDTGCGTMFVTVNNDASNNNIYEVLLKASSTGGCMAFADGIARVISVAIRYGAPVEVLIDQLHSVRCDNFRYQVGKNPKLVGKSCPDVVSRVMADVLKANKQNIPDEKLPTRTGILYADNVGTPVKLPEEESIDDYKKCPVCGAELELAGCKTCLECGWSKC